MVTFEQRVALMAWFGRLLEAAVAEDVERYQEAEGRLLETGVKVSIHGLNLSLAGPRRWRMVEISELAYETSIHPQTLTSWARLGIIPAITPTKGSRFFILHDVLQALKSRFGSGYREISLREAVAERTTGQKLSNLRAELAAARRKIDRLTWERDEVVQERDRLVAWKKHRLALNKKSDRRKRERLARERRGESTCRALVPMWLVEVGRGIIPGSAPDRNSVASDENRY